MTQLNLVLPPYQKHSETSKQAAVDIGSARETLRQKVFALLRKVGEDGLTDEEMQNMLYMNPSTQRPRRIELVDNGQVCDSGLTRLTKSGRKATVWVAKQSSIE